MVGRCGLLQRLDVFDQLEQAFFAHQALKGRHDRLEPGRDLRARVEDRFADVRLVDDDRLAGLQLDGLAEQVLQHRPSALRIGPVAGVAGEIGEQLLPAEASDPSSVPPLSQV